MLSHAFVLSSVSVKSSFLLLDSVAYGAARLSGRRLRCGFACTEESTKPVEDVVTATLWRMGFLSPLLQIHDPQVLVIDPPMPLVEGYLPLLEQAI